MTRVAVFVATYFSFEHELNTLCKRVREVNNISLAVRDLNHKGIVACKIYLKKACGIAFPDDMQEWCRIKQYNKIRNLLVHSDAIVGPRSDGDNKTDTDKLYDFVDAQAEIEIDDDSKLQLLQGFCEMVLDDIQAFHSALLKQIEIKMEN